MNPLPHDTDHTPALRLVTPDTPVTRPPADDTPSEVLRTPAEDLDINLDVTPTPDTATAAPPLFRPITYFGVAITAFGNIVLAAVMALGGDRAFGLGSVAVLTFCGLVLCLCEVVPQLMIRQEIQHTREAQAMADAK